MLGDVEAYSLALKRTAKTPENGGLEDFPFGKVVLRGYVSFRVVIFQKGLTF